MSSRHAQIIGGMTITLGIHEARDPEHLRRS